MSDDAFVRHLVEWQPFYAAVAGAAATLTGLLFVALSINRARLDTDGHRRIRRLARRSFGDFLFVFGVAMVMLVPKQDPLSVAGLLFGLGLLRLFRIARESRDPAHRHRGRLPFRETLAEYALPVGSCLGLSATAVAMGLGHFTAIYFLVVILLELVSTASRNAWQLLMLDDDVAPGRSSERV